MELNDTVLLERWTRFRDSDAFMELVVRHSAMVYATCLRILGNSADAEDVTQECFLELARAQGRIKKTHAGWLHAVAAKRAALRIRSETRRRARERVYAANQSTQQEPKWEDVAAEVDASIAKLPEALRAAIVLRFLEGLTYEETGRRLGIPASTAQSRIEKGLEHLRRLLTKRGIASSSSVLAGLLLTHTARGAQVPPGLTDSLGKMALAKGAPATVGAGILATGGLLVMK